jgi:aerobic-type carbon monoxide dehydrogenase small subunit (CoxS/CutS family)
MADNHEQKKKSSSHDASRRKFLKDVGVAGAGAALADSLLRHDVSAANSALPAPDDPVSGSVNIVLDVNGQKRTVTVEPRTTLLSSMRDRLEPAITGPKLVCDMGTCGACTVIMDDKPVYSCLVLAVDAAGKKLTTAEGLGSPDNLNEVQKAFVAHDALMCGFCTPGFGTTIAAYLKTNSNPTLEEVREACKGNFCRCGTYPRVFEAALAAAKAGAVSG